MSVSNAVWCIACGATPDVAITVERSGVLAHYGACWDHVATVALRARDDLTPPQYRLGPQQTTSGRTAGAGGQPAIEAQADG